MFKTRIDCDSCGGLGATFTGGALARCACVVVSGANSHRCSRACEVFWNAIAVPGSDEVDVESAFVALSSMLAVLADHANVPRAHLLEQVRQFIEQCEEQRPDCRAESSS